MVMKTNTASEILTPEQVAELIVRPVMDYSVAVQLSTELHIEAHSLRIPMVTSDPSAAWVAEGAEITPSDMDFDEMTVTPSKVAGLSIISNELADDSSEEAAQMIGDGLARDIARKVDAAYFSNTTSNGPSGLLSLIGVSPVNAGTAWANTDPFAEALSIAEGNNTTLTNFVANPADALAIAKVKKGTGSNEPLLSSDPTSPSRRVLLGVPLLVSSLVAVGTIWGIPKDRSIVVVRKDASVEVDTSPFFTSDRTAIRAVMRVGFGFTQNSAIVKITKSA